ncbi:MAG TPA: carotenoid biosynthesis protein [Thermodesulfovibrionales bacterium]|jgi:putative membrane protein|nr:carotenoid biosynthesis protein [Thermodesulfovibrionales bacterium]
MEPLSLLLSTILLRPYVFVFFLAYFFGCSLHLGIKRAALFIVVGYIIAWLSEYSSIHNGIPYGYYYYIEQTRGRELWVLGIPFMDSMSYVFLAYASYAMALAVTSPILSRGPLYLLETKMLRKSLSTRILGAVFFLYLDIIIDPLALRGKEWFLGQIYGYPQKGAYFGVPISNFAGWLIVGFLMIYALQLIDAYLDSSRIRDYAGYRYPWRYLIGPGLYLGVLAFNLCMAFAIRDHHLAWTGVFIVTLPLFLLSSMLKQKRTLPDEDDALRTHLADFPLAAIPEGRPGNSLIKGSGW